MVVVRKNAHSSTSWLEVLPSDVLGELIPLLKEKTWKLMLVSKHIFETLAGAQAVWRKILPSRYRWVDDSCAVMMLAWKKKQKIMDKSTLLKTGSNPIRLNEPLCESSGFVYCPLARGILTRIVRLYASVYDPIGVTTPHDITQSIAVEKILTDDLEAVARRIGDEIYPILRTVLVTHDCFSPELFRALSRRYNLIDLFFSLRISLPRYTEKARDLARFALEKYYVLGLYMCLPEELKQLETWFGPELSNLSIEYRIFGAKGLCDFQAIPPMPINSSLWRSFVSNDGISREVPQNIVDKITEEYLRRLVRVSKYVFHDAEQLIRFVLWVLRNGYKEGLLRLEDSVDGAYLDTFPLELGEAEKGVIEKIVEDDEAPLCPTPQYGEDRDFVYGRFGPRLIRTWSVSTQIEQFSEMKF